MAACAQPCPPPPPFSGGKEMCTIERRTPEAPSGGSITPTGRPVAALAPAAAAAAPTALAAPPGGAPLLPPAPVGAGADASSPVELSVTFRQQRFIFDAPSGLFKKLAFPTHERFEHYLKVRAGGPSFGGERGPLSGHGRTTSPRTTSRWARIREPLPGAVHEH